MKTTKKHSQTHKIIIVLASILVLALITAGVAFLSTNQQSEQRTTDASEDTKTTETESENLNVNPDSKSESNNTDKPKSPTVTEDGTKSVVQMTVSANISNNIVYIRGGINNASIANGTCYAQLTKSSGESKRLDTILLQNPTTTDCKTIALNTSELSSGTWTVKLYFSSNNIEGVSNETSIEIK